MMAVLTLQPSQAPPLPTALLPLPSTPLTPQSKASWLSSGECGSLQLGHFTQLKKETRGLQERGARERCSFKVCVCLCVSLPRLPKRQQVQKK